MARPLLVTTSRRRILREVVEVLGESAALTDTRGRHQWRRELIELLDGPEWAELPTARQEFVEAVRVCAGHPGGLELLQEATSLVAPVLRQKLAPLLEELYALEVYEGRDWTALRNALSLTLPELNTLVAEITGDRVRLPAYCATAWQAFVHLSGRNAQPGEVLPPAMVLLEHLALSADLASLVGELHAWTDHFAERWEVTEADGGLRDLRASLGEHHPARAAFALPEPATSGDAPPVKPDAAVERPVIRLFIKLAPDLTPADGNGRRQHRRNHRYRVSARVKYAESAGLHHETEGEPPESVPRNRLPVAVADLLTRMAALWQSRAEDVVLEFFLPAELLNEPVEWWDRDPELTYANPLFSKYPEILVHSLDRLQRRDLHHVWRTRWARWKSDPESADVHWCDPQDRPRGEHLALLDARIGGHDEVMAMVLSGPPQPHTSIAVEELRLGLDLGIPVFIHHREASTEEFRSVVRDGLAEGGLAKLPDRARQLKGNSATRGGHHDPAQHLSVIWDDPEQLLDGGASAPAAFVGGID